MGCDIHLYTESKVNGVWVCNDNIRKDPYGEGDDCIGVQYGELFYSWRNYTLFDTLAGVRGGGFYQQFEVKGLPSDISDELRACYEYWGLDAHTSTYITLSELEEYLSRDFRLDNDKLKHAIGEWINDLDSSIGEVPDLAQMLEGTTNTIKKMEKYLNASPLNEEETWVYNELDKWASRLRDFDGEDHRIVFWFDN